MTTKYHTLCVRVNGRWSPEFGDYDKEVVRDERDDVRDGGGIPARDLKIITTADDQASINAGVAHLNNR